MAVYIIITAAILCCILTAVLCRRYVQRAFVSLEAVLDRILTKKAAPITDTTGEDRVSKLTYKANRIVDMLSSEAQQASSEKETIQSFISDMSHQMKTPLSAVTMYTDLLLEGNLSDDEQREFLQRLKSSTATLQWLMDSLIKMSRLEVGTIALSPEPSMIRQAIDDAVGSITALASKKDINVSVSGFGDITLCFDRKWTVEVLINILENAVKYSTQGGKIEIDAETMPLYTKIAVTDHGAGIDKDEFNLIFKRFYRGKNVKDKEGAGLGLYLASLIMEKQNGYIMVDSKPGAFTQFSLFFRNMQSRIDI